MHDTVVLGASRIGWYSPTGAISAQMVSGSTDAQPGPVTQFPSVASYASYEAGTALEKSEEVFPKLLVELAYCLAVI